MDLKTADAQAFLGRVLKSGGSKYLVTEILQVDGLKLQVKVEEVGNKSFSTSTVVRYSDGKLAYTFLEPEGPKEPTYQIY